MNIVSLKEELDKDVIIDVTALSTVCYDIPKITAKWLRYRQDAKSQLLKAESQLRNIRRDRFLYYAGKHPDEVSDMLVEKSEMKVVLEGDEEVRKAQMTFDHCKNTVAFCDDAVKTIRDMGFSVKNMIDLRKLETGVV